MVESSSPLLVETSPSGDEVFVHGSPEALRRLAAHLVRLAEQAETGQHSDGHLFSEAWGGYDLAGTRTAPDRHAVHHLKLYGWPTAGEIPVHGA
jgi:hypothetical protein